MIKEIADSFLFFFLNKRLVRSVDKIRKNLVAPTFAEILVVKIIEINIRQIESNGWPNRIDQFLLATARINLQILVSRSVLKPNILRSIVQQFSSQVEKRKKETSLDVIRAIKEMEIVSNLGTVLPSTKESANES